MSEFVERIGEKFAVSKNPLRPLLTLLGVFDLQPGVDRIGKRLQLFNTVHGAQVRFDCPHLGIDLVMSVGDRKLRVDQILSARTQDGGTLVRRGIVGKLPDFGGSLLKLRQPVIDIPDLLDQIHNFIRAPQGVKVQHHDTAVR